MFHPQCYTNIEQYIVIRNQKISVFETAKPFTGSKMLKISNETEGIWTATWSWWSILNPYKTIKWLNTQERQLSHSKNGPF